MFCQSKESTYLCVAEKPHLPRTKNKKERLATHPTSIYNEEKKREYTKN